MKFASLKSVTPADKQNEKLDSTFCLFYWCTKQEVENWTMYRLIPSALSHFCFWSLMSIQYFWHLATIFWDVHCSTVGKFNQFIYLLFKNYKLFRFDSIFICFFWNLINLFHWSYNGNWLSNFLPCSLSLVCIKCYNRKSERLPDRRQKSFSVRKILRISNFK